ncbi:trypsin-like peptidase domain-containing protein [Staphylococcus taiwanensis]|nr:trypsin-like peptidase domain-containing protein [Staphylococcus taiwanensis]
MDNDKKHVIPRDKYRRKRHEYFHNEEREERIKQEREQRERLARKEQEQAKVNEERVKDNLRKARIEKLTQEEIQQQQHLAKVRSEQESTTVSNDKEEHHNLTLPEEQQLKKDREETHANDASSSSKSREVTHYNNDNNHHGHDNSGERQPELSRVKKNKEKEQLSVNPKENTNKNETLSNKNEQQQKSEQKHVEKKQVIDKNKDSNKTENNNKRPKEDIESKTNNNHQKESLEKQNDSNKSEEKTKTNQYEAHSATQEESNTNSDALETVKRFFKLHWLKIVIVVAILLIIILISAIISEMNQNSSVHQSEHHHTKYTSTMKNANSTVNSIVTVENDTPKNTSKINNTKNTNNEVGSGVVYKNVDDTFFILTNAHIVGNSDNIVISYGDNQSTKATVVGKDMWSDIAVLKASFKDKKIKPIKMGDSSKLILGESIIIVGNPLGNDFKNTVSKGIISGLDRAVPVDFDKDNKNDELIKTFQIDAAVNPGNSGGAVVNRYGELVGIVSLKINMPNIEGMGFAIPINDAKSIATELEKKGKVEYPNTGLAIKNVEDLNNYERQLLKIPNQLNYGIVIEKLKDDGLGKKSGLKTGDVVVELDSKSIKDNLHYRQTIFNHRQDLKTLSAKIYRDGKSQEIKIKLK